MTDHEADELSVVFSCLDNIYDSLGISTPHQIHSAENEPTNGFAVSIDQEEHQLLQSVQMKTSRDSCRRGTKPLPYSTALQRRKKEELRDLRLEAQHLSVQLASLVRTIDSVQEVGLSTLSPENQSTWRTRSMIECEKRVRSERTNRELKAVLQQQFKVFQSIRKELGQKEVLEGMYFVEQMQPMADRPFFQLDFSDPILSELSSNLDQLFLQLDNVFPVIEDSLAVAFRSQNRCATSSGNCFEMTSVTPLACSVREAGDMVWRFISNKGEAAPEKTFSFAQERPPQFCEEVYNTSCIASLIMENASAPLHVDAVSTFRKYEGIDRDALVGSMKWFLPTEGLEFEATYWSVVSPSPTDPERSSIVRICYRLQANNWGTRSTTVTQHAMTCIGTQVRSYLQMQQDVLLDMTG